MLAMIFDRPILGFWYQNLTIDESTVLRCLFIMLYIVGNTRLFTLRYS